MSYLDTFTRVLLSTIIDTFDWDWESRAHWKSIGMSEQTWPCLVSYLRSCHAGGIDWHRGCWCWWWDRWGRCQGSCWGHSPGRCSEGPSTAHRGRTLVKETRAGGFRRTVWELVLFSSLTDLTVIFGDVEETVTSSGFMSSCCIHLSIHLHFQWTCDLRIQTCSLIYLLCWFI